MYYIINFANMQLLTPNGFVTLTEAEECLMELEYNIQRECRIVKSVVSNKD